MFDPEQIYYIYCYLDEAGEPYYFGKGKGFRAWGKHTTVEIPPDDRIKIVMDGLDEESALRCEKICIDYYGREKDGGTLKNRYPGGHRGAPAGKDNPLHGKFGPEHPMYGRTGAQHPTFGREGAMKGRTGSKHPRYGMPGAWEGQTGANHPRSNKYGLISPTGEIFEVHGLAAFCREHGLTYSAMHRVTQGKRRSHKGWLSAEYSEKWDNREPKASSNAKKRFIVISPSGEMSLICGLKAFCSERGLQQSNMTAVAKGRLSHHKGWKCVHLD